MEAEGVYAVQVKTGEFRNTVFTLLISRADLINRNFIMNPAQEFIWWLTGLATLDDKYYQL
jgi:hypothetical protein